MDTLKKLAEFHFRSGKDRKQVAVMLGVSLPKLYKIFGSKKALEEAEKSQIIAEYEVENALLKKACGYSYTEIKETEKPGGIEVVTTHKEVAPDVSAAKAWLENKSTGGWGEEKSSSEEKLDIILGKLDSNMESRI